LEVRFVESKAYAVREQFIFVFEKRGQPSSVALKIANTAGRLKRRK